MPGDLYKLLFEVLGERFCSHKSFENSGILGVLRNSQNALLRQKIRSKRKRVVFRGAPLFIRSLLSLRTSVRAGSQ